MIGKKEKQNKKISLTSLILIIIATEFGFDNIVSGYNQMSYAGIIWYIIGSAIYMFPLAMIFAEYSGSIKNDHGGFYSWLINSVGEKWAFIGTFVWVSFWLINLLQNISGLGIEFSELFLGKDVSQSWHFGPLDSNEIEALIGAVFIILATFLATKGVKKIAVTATIGGVISLSIIGIFVISSFIILAANHGHLAQPIHGIRSFEVSPNPAFQSPIEILSFIIYAMFAFGGLESSSGLIDKLKNPRKTFPRAMLIVSGIVTAMYVFGILICGFGINWQKVLGQPNINLYNNGFYLMDGLGVSLAKSLGWSVSVGSMIGATLTRVLAFGLLVPMVGMLIVLIYSPIKGLIAGSSKDLWPKKIDEFNDHDMPSHAMWIECALIVVILMLVSVTGSNGAQFYQIIVDMGNIGGVVPYFFIVLSFIAFKKRKDLEHPIVFFHSMKSVYAVVTLLIATMVFAVVMNFISPMMNHQYSTTFWTFFGPVIFIALACVMYHLGIKHRAKRIIADNMDYYHLKRK